MSAWSYITLPFLLMLSIYLNVNGDSHIPSWVEEQHGAYRIPTEYDYNDVDPALKYTEGANVMKKFIYKRLAAQQLAQEAMTVVNYADENVSAQCALDMKVLDAAMKLPDVYNWTYMYMNADAKDTFPPTGFYLGKAYSVGSGELCRRIKATNMDVYEVVGNVTMLQGLTDIDILNTTPNVAYVGKHSFNAHHCKAQWSRSDFQIGMSEGWCLPASCDRDDVIKMMDDNQVFPWKLSYCGTRPELKKDVGGIIAIVISSLFLVLVVTSSLVDGTRTWLAKRKAEEEEEENSYNFTGTSFGGGKSAVETADYNLKEQSAVYRAFVAFSVFRTLPTVLDTGGARAKYGCMNGLRFFAMAWITCGHVGDITSTILVNSRTVVIANMFQQFEYKTRFLHQLLTNMNLSVDIFFFLGATLATLSFMKTLKKLEKEGHMARLKAMGLHVFHRYWRLTPLLAAVLMIVPNLYTYITYGTIAPERVDQFASCKNSWWSLLLYIQNLYRGPEGDCLGWTWYLANDFQFYLIMPLFAVLLYISPFFGPAFLFLGWLGTTIARAYLVSQPLKDGYWELYVKPWARFGPYAIGIAMGHVLYRTKAARVKIHPFIVLLGWIVSTLVTVLILFGTYMRRSGCEAEGCIPWSEPEQRAYNILRRDAFALCLAWTIFACINGYGGYLNSFLSWDFFTPLSKLTYAGYLLHPVVHGITMCSREELFYLQDITFIYQFLFVLTMTLVVSVGFTLVFEVPFLALEKIILKKDK